MILTLQPKETPAGVAAKLAELIPSLKVKPKKVWSWELQLELPNRVTVSIHSTRSGGSWSRSSNGGPLEKICIVYESDYYNGYKNKDALRRAVQFKHDGTHNVYQATALTMDVAAVRSKLSEVMTFAEQNETRLAQRRESLTAGENHSKEAAKHFRDLLIAEGLEEFTAAPSRICTSMDHDTRKDFDRPLALSLRLTDEQGIQVIRLLKQLEAEQT